MVIFTLPIINLLNDSDYCNNIPNLRVDDLLDRPCHVVYATKGFGLFVHVAATLNVSGPAVVDCVGSNEIVWIIEFPVNVFQIVRSGFSVVFL